MEPDKARALTRQWQHKQPAERAAIIREHFGAMLHALTHLIPDDAPTAVVEADEHPVIAAVVERQLLLLRGRRNRY